MGQGELFDRKEKEIAAVSGDALFVVVGTESGLEVFPEGRNERQKKKSPKIDIGNG